MMNSYPDTLDLHFRHFVRSHWKSKFTEETKKAFRMFVDFFKKKLIFTGS